MPGTMPMAKGGKKAGKKAPEPAPEEGQEEKDAGPETTTVRLIIKDAEGLSELGRLTGLKSAALAFDKYFGSRLDHLLILLNRKRVSELESAARQEPPDVASLPPESNPPAGG